MYFYMYDHVCMYVCIYIYIITCVYIYTYIYAHINTSPLASSPNHQVPHQQMFWHGTLARERMVADGQTDIAGRYSGPGVHASPMSR